MLIAILGDVHANREALESVLRDARKAGAERFWQVGDIVGYGPDPTFCIELLQSLGVQLCLGNHDAAAVRLLPLDIFNPFARMALEWTMFELHRPHREMLKQLPLLNVQSEFDATLVHGSLYQPEQFDYVRSLASAARSLEQQKTQLCFVGHSHQPCLFARDEGGSCEYLSEFRREGFYQIQDSERLLVNVGSVGQPRDEDPRAAYVLYDTEERSLRLVRVDYDIEAVQERMRHKGLPHMLAERLAIGL